MTAQRIQGITFDLDGTLADTLPVCYEAFRRVFLTHTGREWSDGEIHALFGPCEAGTIQKVVADWKPALAMFLREYEAAHDACLEPFPGIVSLLDWLHERGVRVAVVTGKGADSAAISLRRLGLNGQFEIVEAGSPEGGIKAQSIRRVLDVWQVPASAVAHIGDAPGDIRAAKECGLTALGAAWASTADEEQLARLAPDVIFRSVEDFREWLSGKVGT